MRFICVYLFLQTVSAQVGFGGYFGQSRVCQKWQCLNRKFSFTDVLPEKDQYKDVVKEFFAIDFHTVAEQAVDRCYEAEATAKFTNTCPGQALLHCVMDKLIQNCPESFWNQNDGCSSVASLAGNSYMFSQSRYLNLQRNLPLERRPSTFLLNYFRSRCCDIQQMLNESLLSECDISEMLHYFDREPQLSTPFRKGPSIEDITPKTTDGGVIGQVYNFHLLPEITTSATNIEYYTNADDDKDGNDEGQDPLACCEEIARFIRPDWRTDCDFQLKWDPQRRLINVNRTEQQNNKEQCEDLTPSASCVLNKMNILNQFGFIDHFMMKNKIRAYSNGKTSYMYAVFNSAFLNAPHYMDQCDSSKRLFNLLDSMLVVCDPAKRLSNGQCNKMFTDIRNAVSDVTKENLDIIVHNQNQNVQYHVGFFPSPKVLQPENLHFTTSTSKPNSHVAEPKTKIQNNKKYNFGVLGLLGNPPPVVTLDLKPKNKTLVLLPVYQRMPNDSLAINSLHDDGVWRS